MQTLWSLLQVLSALTPQQNAADVAALTGVSLKLANANEYANFYESAPLKLDGGIVVGSLGVRERKTGKSDPLTIYLSDFQGSCVTQAMLKQHGVTDFGLPSPVSPPPMGSAGAWPDDIRYRETLSAKYKGKIVSLLFKGREIKLASQCLESMTININSGDSGKS
ncbi:MAG: hypothetical protein LBV44_10305 [Methylobacillus sp.]|nr:hypothetical protein [Methylobacillus sp.]